MMNLKNSKWLLLPACLLLGLALLVAFVSISQNYLSDYLIRNSKTHLGQKIDPEKLSRVLNAPEMTTSPSPLLLVFWSMTCSPCLEKLKKLPDQSLTGYRLLPINTDPENLIPAAQKIFSSHLPNQPFYHDPQKTLVTELEINYLPTNIYLSIDGTIEKIEIGEK
ncbi:hypothetical protein K2X05_07620 [bacterium]|nr:hypothetical protein [bacterium]